MIDSRVVVLAVALLTPAVLGGCALLDKAEHLYLRRRRLRRLRTTSVVRPRCVVLPSPGRRAATFPRRGAVHSHGRRR